MTDNNAPANCMISPAKTSNIEPIDILAFTPIFPPASGGGAQYANFLARHLPQIPFIRKVTIITEKWPGMEENIVIRGTNFQTETTVLRKLSRFHGLPSRMARRYPAYLLQNIQLLQWLNWGISNVTAKTVVMIHGAFLIHPSVLLFATQWHKSRQGDRIRFILDCRDPSTPESRLKRLYGFDAAISCGARLTSRLKNALPDSVQVTEIPVPVAFWDVHKDEEDRALLEFGLVKGGYIFSPNGVKDAKGFPLLFDAWRELHGDLRFLDLVIAGDTRDWRLRYQDPHPHGSRLINLGCISNQKIRALMKGSAAVINPSQVESLSRICLEALSLGVPTILPPGIPEFEELDEKFLGLTNDPVKLANQIGSIVTQNLVAPYDLTKHNEDMVRERYREFFQSLLP